MPTRLLRALTASAVLVVPAFGCGGDASSSETRPPAPELPEVTTASTPSSGSAPLPTGPADTKAFQDAEQDTLDAVARVHRISAVRAAIDDLPERERHVVRLMHLEQLTQPEIADRLALPVGTVKSRAHRAHRRLAAELRHLRGAS